MRTGFSVGMGVLLAILAFFVASGRATLVDDPAAIMSDRVYFGSMDGFVDYAVYEPGEYTGSMNFHDLYVYAYQVFNEDPEISMDFFSVGRCPDVTIPNTLYDPAMGWAVPGGNIPSMSLVLPNSLLYVFQFDSIGAGEHSQTLLFTSDCPPAMAMGIVSCGIMGGDAVEVPSPSQIPEPLSLSIIAMGVPLMHLLRRGMLR